MSKAKPNLVFFGIETSDFEKNSNMLQIFMKSGSLTFNSYVNPIKPISPEMTKINHLTVRFLQLYRDDVHKPSRPLPKVMELLLQYLKQFSGPCILVSHKYCFSDACHLIRAIKQLSMEKEFASVIVGFTDTFRLYREKFPENEAKDLVLHKLATKAGVLLTHPSRSGRSIKNNTICLEKLALGSFSIDEMKVQRTFIQQVRYFEKSPQGSWMVRAKFTEPAGATAGPQTMRGKRLKRALRQKENIEEKVPEKKKRKMHDTMDFRKRVKVVSTSPEMPYHPVSLRTRTRVALKKNPMVDL